jgi:signal transduction histidine kinase
VDITDLKRRQEEWLAAQKLESLGVLVAGVAHNFNNQMGTILAEADLALSEIPEDSPAYESVQRMDAAAMRASNVVALLMAYAGGHPATAPSRVDLSLLAQESLELIRATASKNASFSVDLCPRLPPISADVSRIRQVIMNLLTNAYESLPNHEGSIHLATSCVRDGNGDAATDRYVRLSVTDSGCGIAGQDRAKIFDPFYTTKSLGRGLGLASVQGIARSLGGEIHVQSTPGQGSTFEVLFPCSGGDDAAVRD